MDNEKLTLFKRKTKYYNYVIVIKELNWMWMKKIKLMKYLKNYTEKHLKCSCNWILLK